MNGMGLKEFIEYKKSRGVNFNDEKLTILNYLKKKSIGVFVQNAEGKSAKIILHVTMCAGGGCVVTVKLNWKGLTPVNLISQMASFEDGCGFKILNQLNNIALTEMKKDLEG